MSRKLALMFVVGVCCALVGTFQYPVFGSDKCQDMEIMKASCPIQDGYGSPNVHSCTAHTGNGAWVCENPDFAPTSDVEKNTYVTKASVGKRVVPTIVVGPLGPGVATVKCYTMYTCYYDDFIGVCFEAGSQDIPQFLYTTEACPSGPPAPRS
jgi:hypothetical protein